jgi:hypothetical protein
LPPHRPVRAVQFPTDLLRERLQLADDPTHLLKLYLQLLLPPRLRPEPFQLGAGVTNPRLELLLLDQPLAVRVDQLANLPLHTRCLHLELSLVHRRVPGLLADAQAALVLLFDPTRLRQQG